MREARPEELAEVGRLSIEAYAEFAPYLGPGGWTRMREGIASAARPNGGTVIVAEERGRILGSVVYFPPGSDKGGSYPKDWAAIRLLAVSPAARGKGVGRSLVEDCLRRAEGAGEVGLHTSELMVAARSMYEHMGFVLREELPPVFGVRYWSYSLGVP